MASRTLRGASTGAGALTALLLASLLTVPTAGAQTSETNQADVSITKTGPGGPVTQGSNFDFTLTVTNVGTAEATQVIVEDTLPAGLTYVDHGPCFAGSFSPATNTIGCNVGTLAPGASVTVTITVKANQAGDFSNTATVESPEEPTPGANNSSTARVRVNPAEADVSIVKTGPPGPVTQGSNFDFTFTVANAGPAAATQVIVTDALPAGLTFVSAGSACLAGSFNVATNTVTCNVGTLAPGASVTVTITVKANQAGDISNTATVASPQEPTPGANNSSTARVTVNPGTNLVVSRASVDFGDVAVGQRATGTVRVTNNGPGTANFKQIAITAGAPAFAIVGNTCGATLAVGASCDITVAFTPPSAGPFSGNLLIDDAPINIPLTGRGVAPAGGGPGTNTQGNANTQNAIGGATGGGGGNTGGSGGASQSNSTAGPANGGIGGAGGGGTTGTTCPAASGFFAAPGTPAFMTGNMACARANPPSGGGGGNANGTSASAAESSADGGKAGGGNETHKHKSKKSKAKSKKKKHRRH